jgi:intracellular sulfur oxidation DsrE/DsrF family protein
MFATSFTARHAALACATIAVVVASGVAATRPQAAQADVTSSQPADRWLTKLNGKHRQLFDSPAPAGGIALIHILNYYDTYNSAYKVRDADINAVGTFYGATTFFALNDAMWAKYRLGEFLSENGASGRPAVANPWRTSPVIIGAPIPAASIESLQKRGASFIVCNNALSIFAGLLANARGLDAKVVYEDMKANILPEVELIPAMVVAIEQAHKAGLAYHRQ